MIRITCLHLRVNTTPHSPKNLESNIVVQTVNPRKNASPMEFNILDSKLRNYSTESYNRNINFCNSSAYNRYINFCIENTSNQEKPLNKYFIIILVIIMNNNLNHYAVSFQIYLWRIVVKDCLLIIYLAHLIV